jgi:NAD dependent epimerase/dehydratase family enzyme
VVARNKSSEREFLAGREHCGNRPATIRKDREGLGRPTIFPMPAVVARVIFGEMAGALLLGSARVQPTRLEGSGYRFHFPDLETTLRHLLLK